MKALILMFALTLMVGSAQASMDLEAANPANDVESLLTEGAPRPEKALGEEFVPETCLQHDNQNRLPADAEEDKALPLPEKGVHNA